jgi:hypothetical protein
MGWPAGQGPNRLRSRAAGARPRAEEPSYEEDSASDVPEVIYVRDEESSLLWRSIVQGFGLLIGFVVGTFTVWAFITILVVLLFRQAAPRLPVL